MSPAILVAMPLVAHAGHWALYGLYLVPVVIVLGSILTTVVRDRRQRRAGAPPPRA